MKKLFTLFTMIVAFTVASFAQLPDNSVAPDWTLRDLNGTTHHLYNYLDSGYTVFIDFSAAWCGPCWSYHNTHALRDVYEQHGPTGYPSVSATTTNDAMVFYIEGEATNTTAQLHGTTSGTAHSTFSQGDWVTGTTYPIIDTGSYVNTLNSAYQIGYFPTVYKICPNRLITEIGQATAATLYAGVGTCPSIATSLNDPFLTQYTGDNLSVCGALNIKAVMQNHGTSALTSATVKVYQGATEIGSYNWSGSLATYAVTTVNVGSVNVTSGGGPVTVKITSTNDDLTNDQVGVTYTLVGNTSVPATNDMESAADLNTPPTGAYVQDKVFAPLFISTGDFTTAPPISIGAFGASDKSILFDFFEASNVGDVASVIFDKVTIPTLVTNDHIMLDFDYSYAPYVTNDLDKIEVMYSTNCGSSWTTPFNKSGATLATADTNRNFYVPSVSTEWKTESFDITSGVTSGANVLVKVKGTSAYGNNAYVDNVKVYLKNTTGIKELVSDENISVYPNPSSDIINISYTSDKNQEVTIKLADSKGQIVYQNAKNATNGNNAETINVQNVTPGSYILSIISEGKIASKKVTINH